MEFVKFTKRFVVRSLSLFTIEHRFLEADSFKTPTSFVELTNDLNDLAGEFKKDIEKLQTELQSLGFQYVELYKCDKQDDGVEVSFTEGELIFSRRGNLHGGVTTELENKLSQLGFEVIFC